MIDFLNWTAVPMTQPEPYGLFYWLMIGTGLPLTLALAWRIRIYPADNLRRLLAILGLILLVSEGYKQLFSYYIVNVGHYDWWIFPWQLCSLPMYLTILLPFSTTKQRTRIETFLMDFNLLGAIMALAVPDGLLHSYLTLTLHSFLWHFILLFIGLSLIFSKLGNTSKQGFLSTLPLFAIAVLIAQIINVILHPYGEISMFYISPYLTSTQPFIHDIAQTFGIPISNLFYLTAMLCGAALLHGLINQYRKRRNHT